MLTRPGDGSTEGKPPRRGTHQALRSPRRVAPAPAATTATIARVFAGATSAAAASTTAAVIDHTAIPPAAAPSVPVARAPRRSRRK